MRIRWGWLGFLLVELALAFVFLAGSIVTTSRASLQIIKGSSLATMVALDEKVRYQFGGINNMDRLQEKAATVDVQMEKSTSGVGLALGMGYK